MGGVAKAVGGIVGGVTGALGLTADESAGAEAFGGSRFAMDKAVRVLESVGIPTIEAQRIVLEEPELVGELIPEELKSELFQLSPEMRELQLGEIKELQKIADEGGLSTEERARLNELRRVSAQDEQARQQSILQDFAERGVGGAGNELIARLQSSQSQADRGSQEADRLAVAAAQGRRGALQQLSEAARGIQSQDVGMAQAKDAISQFNLMNRMSAQERNLAEKQRISDLSTQTRNQQEMYNKQLLQQQFENELRKQQGISQAYLGQTQALTQQAQAQGKAAQANAAGMRELAIGGAKAAFGDGASDGGVSAPGAGSVGQSPMPFFKEGGVVKKPHCMKSGGIIPGEDYTDDNVQINTNSGEMVLNADQQEYLNNLLQNLKNLRTDHKINNGEKQFNEDQQDALFNVVAANKPVEALPDEKIVEDKESKGLKRLLRMLGE